MDVTQDKYRVGPSPPSNAVAKEAPKPKRLPTPADAGIVSEEESAMKIQHDEDNEYLDACQIFLSGLSSERLTLMVKIIRAAGGRRVQELDESVSHVVFGGAELDQDQIDQCRQLRNEPTVVGDKWLIECCKAHEQIPTEPYASEALSLPEPVQKMDGKKPRRRGSTQGKPKKAAEPKQETAVTDQDLDFTSMFANPWESVSAAKPVSGENVTEPTVLGTDGTYFWLPLVYRSPCTFLLFFRAGRSFCLVAAPPPAGHPHVPFCSCSTTQG